MTRVLMALIAALAALDAGAWGADGHSVTAEIAQRRIAPKTAAEIERLLGRGHSLASIASWADDVRDARPDTFNWHFVDIPIDRETYDPAIDCAASNKGDCIIAELDRLRTQLVCAPTDEAKRDALRYAVHFIGDLHQPLHTVNEEQGGNGIKVEVEIQPLKCAKCTPRRTQDNLHAVWDTTLIVNTSWNWGAYVNRLEDGWLATAEARSGTVTDGTPLDWALATHAVAREMWKLTPPDRVITTPYYLKAVPVIDRQLGLAGLRIARFLDDAYATDCAQSRSKK